MRIPDRLPWEPQPEPPSNGTAPAGFTWHEFAGRDYGLAALEREAATVRGTLPGGRNKQLNRSAFAIGQLVHDGRLEREIAYRTLYEAGIAAGLTESEVRRTIASGFAGGAAKPRTRQTAGLYLPSGAATIPEPDGLDEAGSVEEWVRANLPRIDWDWLFSTEDDEEWIVEPLIPARRLVALYSAPKVGKSLLMLELAVHISRGSSVLGVDVDRPRRVLYIDFENDPRGDIRERLRAMGYGPKDLDRLDYLSFPRLAALDTPNGGTQLLAAARVYGSEVVIVDTISRAISGEENENDTWLNFYRHTGRTLKTEGIALVRLDHSGKDETRGQRGGSAKSGDVDMVWRMSKVTEDTYRLDCEAARMPVTEKTLVIHRVLSPRLQHKVDATGRIGAFEAKVQQIIDAANAANVDRSWGRRRIAKWAREIGLKAKDSVYAEVARRRGGSDKDE